MVTRFIRAETDRTWWHTGSKCDRCLADFYRQGFQGYQGYQGEVPKCYLCTTNCGTASGDAGVAVGACYLAHSKSYPTFKPEKQHNFYLGSGFNKDQITDLLQELELDYEIPDNIFKSTAEYLEQGKIIGWFQGRAEFGPRALGNRSILTRPYPASMKDYLNSRVKFRESFRPFAPAVLCEHASDYFEIQQESPHMLIASHATSVAQKKIPATVHVDNSCRVQTVTKENNPRFYDLLCSFHSLTKFANILQWYFLDFFVHSILWV